MPPPTNLMTTDTIVDAAVGSRFTVEIGTTYVFKRPRERPDRPAITKEEMVEIAQMQTEIASKVPYVLPAWVEEDERGPVMVMLRAPGERIKELPSAIRARLAPRLLQIVQDVKEAGFALRDVTPKNCYYDPATDRVTPVDFHLCTRLKEPQQGTTVSLTR